MKADSHLILAPREEREILDEIRNDHELIERLKISTQELDALSKCALLGTLTCKQDLLFILRVIREASDPATDQARLIPEPPDPLDDLEEEEPEEDFSRVSIRVAPRIQAEPGSFEGIVRHRVPEQFGVLFLILVLVGGFVWSGVQVMSRWRHTFITTIGSPAVQASPSQAWFSSLDRFNVLLSWEILFVTSVVVVMYLEYRSGTRRFRVRPGQRFR
jgi:hypothetical protein